MISATLFHSRSAEAFIPAHGRALPPSANSSATMRRPRSSKAFNEIDFPPPGQTVSRTNLRLKAWFFSALSIPAMHLMRRRGKLQVGCFQALDASQRRAEALLRQR